MTREQLDAIRTRVERDFVPRRLDALALLDEVERLRDALALVAAPYGPTVPDLWVGVEVARKTLGEKT